MSAEVLRRAAALMRERAEAATPGRWETSDSDLTHPGAGMNVYSDLEGPVVADCCGYQGGAGIQDAEHIASWHPGMALAVADWLDGTAERHSEGPPTALVLHYDDGPCEVCDDGGHEVPVCEGCFPTWEGMDGYCVYPCRETKAALAAARTYLGEQS